jgi:hypothetical protein
MVLAFQLPAYSGPAAECPECKLSFVAATLHHAAGTFIGEHVCRICALCGNIWVEACPDTQDDDQGSGQCQTSR